ncbi:NAD(P)/FAD-dependent oxidoreductase [Pleurocapsales cyanobacterium LEGE 06147]|nr:NAD(P)/FAD-dependent oxidoreductase [Pleurocapsales cyanobacterium LEGE 06147]
MKSLLDDNFNNSAVAKIVDIGIGITKKIYHSLTRIWERGLFYKLRFSLSKGNLPNPVRLLQTNSPSDFQVGKEESIVVVGIGIASFSFVRCLHRLGYRQVKIVARDNFFGGKCVNNGCMPSEYYTAYRQQAPTAIVEQGQQFVTSLRQITQQSFQELGYPIISGEVTEVKNQEILLKTGEKISFDRLVLATGNQISKFPWLENTCSLQEFWKITDGKLVIVSEGNLASLSYADIACDRQGRSEADRDCKERTSRGIDTTVVFTSNPPLAHLPSWQYFRRELEKRDIKIIVPAKIQGCKPNNLTIKVRGKSEIIPFDHLLYDGAPELNLPQIDGKTKTILDLDLQQANVIGRSDIYVLGDASGFLSATEAELQGKKLAYAWSSGEKIKITDFDRLPLRLHARKSLAIVGSPWTLLSPHWRSLDFKGLGWSAVHNETGKLWYLYNSSEQKVEAIHICHRDASELIALASVLIELPVTDSRWLSCSVHPSAAEIFKLVIEDIEASSSVHEDSSLLGINSPTRDSNVNILRLPPVSQWHQNSLYQTAFSPEERSLGILDRNPHLYFAILLGIKHLLKNDQQQETIPLRCSSEGRYFMPGMNFNYEVNETSAAVVVRIEDEQVTVLSS